MVNTNNIWETDAKMDRKIRSMTLNTLRIVKHELEFIDEAYHSKFRVAVRKFFRVKPPIEEVAIKRLIETIEVQTELIRDDKIGNAEVFSVVDQLSISLMIMISILPQEFAPLIDDLYSKVTYCQSAIKQIGIYD